MGRKYTPENGAGTVWGKVKTISPKGKEFDVTRVTFDTTGKGNMITISWYTDQEVIEKDGKHLFPVNVKKWKGDARTSRKSKGW